MKVSLIFLDSSAVEHSAVNRRVVGSNPTRGVLKSVSQLLADFNFEKINIWLRGQAVKTSPFHGGNTGSIPVGVIWRHSQVVRQRSATPLSPVQIWLAPLIKTPGIFISGCFFIKEYKKSCRWQPLVYYFIIIESSLTYDRRILLHAPHPDHPDE